MKMNFTRMQRVSVISVIYFTLHLSVTSHGGDTREEAETGTSVSKHLFLLSGSGDSWSIINVRESPWYSSDSFQEVIGIPTFTLGIGEANVEKIDLITKTLSTDKRFDGFSPKFKRLFEGIDSFSNPKSRISFRYLESIQFSPEILAVAFVSESEPSKLEEVTRDIAASLRGKLRKSTELIPPSDDLDDIASIWKNSICKSVGFNCTEVIVFPSTEIVLISGNWLGDKNVQEWKLDSENVDKVIGNRSDLGEVLSILTHLKDDSVKGGAIPREKEGRGSH